MFVITAFLLPLFGNMCMKSVPTFTKCSCKKKLSDNNFGTFNVYHIKPIKNCNNQDWLKNVKNKIFTLSDKPCFSMFYSDMQICLLFDDPKFIIRSEVDQKYC